MAINPQKLGYNSYNCDYLFLCMYTYIYIYWDMTGFQVWLVDHWQCRGCLRGFLWRSYSSSVIGHTGASKPRGRDGFLGWEGASWLGGDPIGVQAMAGAGSSRWLYKMGVTPFKHHKIVQFCKIPHKAHETDVVRCFMVFHMPPAALKKHFKTNKI